MKLRSSLVAATSIACVSANATCWELASRTYGVPSELLVAIARAESDLRPLAVNRSHLARTKSYDIGLMQINSSHLPALARWGITKDDLFEPCTNLMVGAWILSDLVRRHGLSWDAVGAYNTACTQLRGSACTESRSKYAWRVYRRLPSTPLPQSASHNVALQFILSARVAP